MVPALLSLDGFGLNEITLACEPIIARASTIPFSAR